MAVRYQVTKGSVALSRKIEQEVIAQIQRNVKSGNPPEQILKFVEKNRFRVYTQAKAYYEGTLESAGKFIRDGHPVSSSVLLDSSKRQSVTRRFQLPGTGTSVVVASGRKADVAWKALPLRYVAVRGRRSKSPGQLYPPVGKWAGLPQGTDNNENRVVFWRKTGQLDYYYQAWLADFKSRGSRLYSGESMKVIKNKIEPVSGSRGKGQNLWQARFQLIFPDLGNPALNEIFRRSFVTMNPAKYRVYQRGGLGIRNGAPRDVSRIAYPEYSRPILARFAALAGRKHRAALVKLLKTF